MGGIYSLVGGFRKRFSLEYPLCRGIYSMRAEAKLRNGDNAGALAPVNTLRRSLHARPNQPLVALNTIALDILSCESGFELYWDGF